jgi:hypothetical protein
LAFDVNVDGRQPGRNHSDGPMALALRDRGDVLSETDRGIEDLLGARCNDPHTSGWLKFNHSVRKIHAAAP